MAQLGQTQRFVDRRPQLAFLAQCYEAAAAGAGGVILIDGDAGSGKSRILDQFFLTLASQQARYAIGQCLEYVQAPFAPFLGAFAILMEKNPAALDAASDVRAVLARLMPALAADVGDEAEIDRLRQLNAMVEALKRFGAERPVVIVVEDAHWADSASLELLQHLASRVTASRVLIVVTFRTEESKRRSALRSALAKLNRQASVQRLTVGPLSDSATHELVFHALEGHDALSPPTIGAICSRAEGNPLFAEELLKTVIESRGVDLQHRLPDTLRDAVLERFAVLGEGERNTLTHAAVIGRRFQAEFLAQLMGNAIEETLPALKRAIELSLVIEESNGDVQFAFKHELTRQAIYGELLTVEARVLHGKIAAALEALPSGDHTVELAYHWWQAREREKAARYNELAGDAAFRVFAYRDALVNFERAIACGQADGAHRAELNLKLAKALHQSGLDERAKRASEAALKYFESIGDRQHAATTLLDLAWRHVGYGDAREALSLTQRALELVGDDPSSPAYFDGHVQMMDLYVRNFWDPQRVQEHLSLVERASGQRTTANRVALLSPLSTYYTGTGRVQEALEATREAATLAMQEDDATSAVRCWANLAVDMANAGENERAQEALDRALAIIRERGVGGLTAEWIRVLYAEAKRRAGELGTARELVLEGVAADIEMPVYRVLVADTGVPVGLQLDDVDLVERCAPKELVDFALRSRVVWTIATTKAFAELHHVSGRHVEAAGLLHKALGSLDRMEAQPAFGDADELFVAVAKYGDDADVAHARRFLERIAASSSVRSTTAHLTLFDAYVAARAGDRPQAAAKARQAADAYREIVWPQYEAQALELEGEDERALAIYRRIGDLRDARRLDAKLNPVNRRGRTKGELTAREREICDLLMKGKTNRAIAEELVLSERTVESHVSSILTKMDAASRGELIAKLKSPA